MKVILLIEDTLPILENLAEFLKMEGYDVLSARSGAEGLRLAQQRLPHLIICDVLMPGMNGHEVLRKLLENEETMHIPFIFSTSMSEKIDRQASLDLGALDNIVKPFEMETLLLLIEKWLKPQNVIGPVTELSPQV